jgi:hypothetical protein
MAKYCDEIFGELLLKEPLKDVHLLPGVPLPSPNQLKGKKALGYSISYNLVIRPLYCPHFKRIPYAGR